MKIKFDKYKFRKYKNNYPALFEKEKIKLKKIIPNAIIEHIGSTSILGLGGKGIVDVLISVPKKDIKKVTDNLINSKYILSKTGGDKERVFFEKSYGLFKRRKVHLHLTYKNSRTYKNAIKFRDCLRRNISLRDNYSAVKQKAISLGKKNKEYREFKEEFIKEVLEK